MGRGTRPADTATVTVRASNEEIRRSFTRRGASPNAPSWLGGDFAVPDESPTLPARMERQAALARLSAINTQAGAPSEAVQAVKQVDKMKDTPWARPLLEQLAGHYLDEVADEQRLFRERLSRAVGLDGTELDWTVAQDGIYHEARTARRRLSEAKLRALALAEHDRSLHTAFFRQFGVRFGGLDPDEYMHRWFTPSECEQILAEQRQLGLAERWHGLSFPWRELIEHYRAEAAHGRRPAAVAYDPTVKAVVRELIRAKDERTLRLFADR